MTVVVGRLNSMHRIEGALIGKPFLKAENITCLAKQICFSSMFPRCVHIRRSFDEDSMNIRRCVHISRSSDEDPTKSDDDPDASSDTILGYRHVWSFRQDVGKTDTPTVVAAASIDASVSGRFAKVLERPDASGAGGRAKASKEAQTDPTNTAALAYQVVWPRCWWPSFVVLGLWGVCLSKN